MTEKALKQLVKVEDWKEVNTTDQFSLILANFHSLAPGVQEKIIAKIPGLTDLTARFFDYCADKLVSYEPTIIMMFAPLIKLMEEIDKGSGGKIKKADRPYVADFYEAFSIWYGRDGEIFWSDDKHEDICTVNEALDIVKDHERADFAEGLDMTLITGEREAFLDAMEKAANARFTVDMDFLKGLLGGDPDKIINEDNFKRYIN